MGALIRAKTSPRLPLEPDDEAFNATLQMRIDAMMAERQARATRRVERAKAKAAKLPKPYRGKAPAKAKAKAKRKWKAPPNRTVKIPLPRG